MAIAPSINEIHPMEVSMDNFIEDYNEWLKTRKDHHLEIEISTAWDDEDEYEHEGYYHTIDDAIKALLSLKQMEKDFQEGNQ